MPSDTTETTPLAAPARDTVPARAPRTWRQRFARLSKTAKIIVFILLAVNVAALIAFLVLGRARINHFFIALGAHLRSLGFAGMAILGLAVMTASHPPLVGFSASMMLVGYAWGMFPGFLIGGAAAQLGGIVAWFSIRTFFLQWIRADGAAKNTHWEAFGHVVREHGLPMMIMVRWCPLPWAFGNGLLAAVEGVKFWQYFITNLTFIPRTLVPVFIGARFRALGDAPDPARVWLNIGSIVVAMGCAIGTGVVVYRRTVRHMQRLDAAPHGEGTRAAEVLEGAVSGYGSVEEYEREQEREREGQRQEV